MGAKMAELYAAIYGSDHPSFQKAGLLRAQAAKSRDFGKIMQIGHKLKNCLKKYTENSKKEKQ